MAAKKLMNVHEALDYLGSRFHLKGKIGCFTSKNEGDKDTDEDSGDENELVLNNLNRS